jgi:hypothetical protein
MVLVHAVDLNEVRPAKPLSQRTVVTKEGYRAKMLIFQDFGKDKQRTSGQLLGELLTDMLFDSGVERNHALL